MKKKQHRAKFVKKFCKRTKNKKERLQKKRDIRKNKELCKLYPFLIPRNRWTDKIHSDYDYSYTELYGLPDGWRKIALEFCEKLREILVEGNCLNVYRIVQLKEKIGGIRWYDNGAPAKNYDKYLEALRELEIASEKTCMWCGKSAKLLNLGGWLSVYCPTCFKRIEIRNRERREWSRAEIDQFSKEFDYEKYVVNKNEA